MYFYFTLFQFLFGWELALNSLKSFFFRQLWISLHQSGELHLWVIEIDADDWVAHVLQDSGFEEKWSIQDDFGLAFEYFQVDHFENDISKNAPMSHSI